jgi:cupin fold WbuC family metalloprotein
MNTTFTADPDIIEIYPDRLAELKTAAADSPLRRARICLHHSHADSVQEMLIAFCRDSYNRPHRHRRKSESFHLIEGRVLIVFFDESGVPTRKVFLGPAGSGLPFVYRLSSDRWHTVIPLDDYVLVHETTTGPFEPGQTEFADWSPDGTDREEANQYIAGLEGRLDLIRHERRAAG